MSAVAVCALLLGLASPLAFIGPLFFLFPVAALGMGVLALSKIRSGDGGLSGGGLARVAIGLATACIMAALVRDVVRDELLRRQASETALRWVELLAEGRIEEARAMLSGDGVATLAPGPAMGEAPRPPAEQEGLVLERLRSEALRRALAGDKRVTVDAVAGPTYDGPKAIAGCTITIGDPAGEHRHASLQLVRHRGYEQSGGPWRVDRWSLDPIEPSDRSNN